MSNSLPEADVATGLDMLLTDGALGPLRRMLPTASGLRTAAGLAARPVTVARRGASLAAELVRIAVGRSDLAPHPNDRRYADPAWSTHPLLRRLVQTHIAASGTASTLVEDAGLDRADRERVRFAVTNLADALAPSNTLLNPVAWRTAIDTRGARVVRGARRLVADLAEPPRVPSTVEPAAFEVGTDLAATPGAVVLRTPVFELIQYLPQTETVREIPLLVVPPTINRYYVADLAPGRSIVEHLVRSGQQVFAMSWRNPDAEHTAWNLDTYGHAVLDAMDACERITRRPATALLALCSGGTITAMLLAHLAAIGARDRVASVTYGATVLDHAVQTENGAGTPTDPASARSAVAASSRQGYLDGATLTEVFAWLRPGDLVWPHWVSTYLCGAPPPTACDIRFWNADTTRMTAGLHRDLLDITLRNALVTPGAATMLGTPVDLSKVDRDCYVIAGAADHLRAWQSCYRTTALLGGNSRFVLSTGGHIASILHPPGGQAGSGEAGFRVADSCPPDPEHWWAASAVEQASWWPDHLAWLAARSGDVCDAPPELGGRGLRALTPAPGEYVLAR